MSSPADKPSVHMNTATASNMPASQQRRSPQRPIARNHSGTETAAAKKYAPKNCPCMDAGNCRRSCTKKSIRVAGTAEAMPLSMNTNNKRRKPAWLHGCCNPRHQGSSATGVSVAAAGLGAYHQAHNARARSTTKPLTNASMPNQPGTSEARMTPASAKPSRQPTIRLRVFVSPPKRAPQACKQMYKKL